MASDDINPAVDTVNLAEVTLDLATLTLGEMAACEIASGQTFGVLLHGSVTRKLVALYVAELRSPLPNGGPRRSWHEISNLRAFLAPSSTSPSSSDGTPTESPD